MAACEREAIEWGGGGRVYVYDDGTETRLGKETGVKG